MEDSGFGSGRNQEGDYGTIGRITNQTCGSLVSFRCRPKVPGNLLDVRVCVRFRTFNTTTDYVHTVCTVRERIPYKVP